MWTTESPDLPGLMTEAESLDALDAKLPGLIHDLIDGMSWKAVSMCWQASPSVFVIARAPRNNLTPELKRILEEARLFLFG